MNQASLALERDQPDAAGASYREALSLRPADPQALLGLGQVYLRQKKLSDRFLCQRCAKTTFRRFCRPECWRCALCQEPQFLFTRARWILQPAAVLPGVDTSQRIWKTQPLRVRTGGRGGVQHFTEDSSLVYPTLTFPTLQQSAYPGDVQTEPNYTATFRMNYRLTDHTNFGFFATANNSRNFATQAIGFSLKFLFHRVPTNPDLQVRSIPDWKGAPPMDLH
jgi:Cellulose synthase operon protein C C-terminus (BCSC_C)/TPR repeat